MFKKVLTTALVGVGIAAAAFTANAEDVEINIYGASAQYKFWNAAADDFLYNELGCTVTSTAIDESEKHGATSGSSCTDGLTYLIRYSSKASYDGIYSCKGEEPPTGQPTCDDEGDRYREMGTDVDGNGTIDSDEFACELVTVGASDVDGKTFGQTSYGLEEGCNGSSATTEDRNISSIDTDGMTYYRPVVVPFGFFANEALLTDTTGATIDNTDGHLTNLTRLQALMIFSGSALYWNDFGTTYPDKDVIVCLRHAGSGTHATLDAAVMRGDWSLVSSEDCPYISFNDGSSDLMNCVNTNGGESILTAAAVGYADADKNASDKYSDSMSLNYNGAAPTKTNIVNGVYSFWSAQWLYECDTTNTDTHSTVVALAAFANDPANLPSSKANYWAAQDELNVTKANDFAMPMLAGE